MPVSVAATPPLVGSADAPTSSAVGVADGAAVGSAGPLGVGRVPSVREVSVGSAVAACGGTVGVGDAVRGEDADGLGTADGAGGVVRSVAGGGASGGAGEVGPSDVPIWRGSATRRAAAQVRAAPIDARTTRRRVALRRIAS
ncbi:hypothetical protein ACM01_37115 [Streptomyces viridochromogenes]|uniref:Uncharacterized protein n=1 Tax=Streptomyces viridochromogenes TaxID=1938 RepID=A0A0J7YZR9_STRVR|nr:hypothetical protein ACM01_37115 [Streptomyces viridochromogenes]KOG11405.1 hypothetical protein ADK36_36835 [Streptomyces viridochromogenes]KOG11957.1 hypothetical protein ADK35_35190 [Streptomyces viridochromogenes]